MCDFRGVSSAAVRCRLLPSRSVEYLHLSQATHLELESRETNRSTSSPLSFSIFAVWVGEGVESEVGDVDCWTGLLRTNFANVVCVPPRGLSEKWSVAGALSGVAETVLSCDSAI